MLKKLIYISLTVLILCAFFGQNYNAYFNGHFHILHSGEWIFHAHPHTKSTTEASALPRHTHTKLQLLSYELLLTSVFLLVLVKIFIKSLLLTFQIFFKLFPHFSAHFFCTFHPHRGPPLFSL